MRLHSTFSTVCAMMILSIFLLPAPQTVALSQPLPKEQLHPQPALQLPPDQQAFKIARAIADPEERLAAMQAFLRDFPKSGRAPSTRNIVIELLIEHHPEQLRTIHELAQLQIDQANKDERAWREGEAARQFAAASPHGIDIQSAEKWALDAVANSTLTIVSARVRASYTKFNRPLPSEEDIHKLWAEQYAGALETLAEVYFDEGKLTEASSLLDEALKLNAIDGEIYAVRGEIAHARHHDAEAVENLEFAEVLGGISQPRQTLLLELYASAHNGETTGLDADLDNRYLALPKAFDPPAYTGANAGRTVFVELYTGSGCGPCAAVDLGVDAVLQAYPRSKVVALSFDLHIPHPDPLANSDTVARAAFSGANYTPVVVVDGQQVNAGGGDRSHTKDVFEAIAKPINAELKVPSGVELRLDARLTPAHTVSASAVVDVKDPAAMENVLASGEKAALGTEPDKVPGARSSAAAAAKARLVVNFALVQESVRYSGENGIRFHSMVVRGIARPSNDAFPVAPAGSSTATCAFDPAAISKALDGYLSRYEKHNDIFGSAHFLNKDTSLPLGELAVAAWVEDPQTHHVVAATLIPLRGAQTPQEQVAR